MPRHSHKIDPPCDEDGSLLNKLLSYLWGTEIASAVAIGHRPASDFALRATTDKMADKSAFANGYQPASPVTSTFVKTTADKKAMGDKSVFVFNFDVTRRRDRDSRFPLDRLRILSFVEGQISNFK